MVLGVKNLASDWLASLEAEAAEVAIRRVREAAYPLIFRLFGGEIPRAKERKLILTQLGQDLARIEKALGYRQRSARDDTREGNCRRRSRQSTKHDGAPSKGLVDRGGKRSDLRRSQVRGARIARYRAGERRR
jgi:hypothetical protein